MVDIHKDATDLHSWLRLCGYTRIPTLDMVEDWLTGWLDLSPGEIITETDPRFHSAVYDAGTRPAPERPIRVGAYLELLERIKTLETKATAADHLATRLESAMEALNQRTAGLDERLEKLEKWQCDHNATGFDLLNKAVEGIEERLTALENKLAFAAPAPPDVKPCDHDWNPTTTCGTTCRKCGAKR